MVYLFLSSCISTPVGIVSSGPYTENFVAAWNCADTMYCSFEGKCVDWQSCYSKHMYFCSRAENDTELRQVLLGIMAELRDQQIQICMDSQVFQAYEKEFHTNINPGVVGSYLESFGGLNWVGAYFGYTSPSDGLSYIQIRRMDEGFPEEEFFQVIDSVYSDSEYLILDMRANSGQNGSGSEEAVAGCFSNMDWTGWYIRERDGGGLSSPEPYILEPNGSVFFNGQVILLTGGFCYGPTELFISAMQALPNTVILGEHTRGCAGAVKEILLPNQWVLVFPNKIVLTSSMQPVEYYGIKPDTLIISTPEDFSLGIDPVLDAAFDIVGVNK